MHDNPSRPTPEGQAGGTDKARLCETPKSPSENWKGSCDEGFWAGPRRRGRRIPAAGCNGRANTGPAQKNRRPKGFRGKGRLASLLLGHRPLAGMLPRRASPSGLFLENRTPSNFQTGSNTIVIPASRSLGRPRELALTEVTMNEMLNPHSEYALSRIPVLDPGPGAIMVGDGPFVSQYRRGFPRLDGNARWQHFPGRGILDGFRMPKQAG